MKPEITLTITDSDGRTRQVAVTSIRTIIGRSEDCDLVIDDPSLSRRHALLEVVDDTAHISDCGSQNGTFLNGRPIMTPAALKDGDAITLGSSRTIRAGIKQIARSQPVPQKRQPPSKLALKQKPEGGLNIPLIAACMAAVIVIFLIIVVIILNSGSNNSKNSNANDNRVITEETTEINTNANKSTSIEITSQRQLDNAASQVVRRISNDDKPYGLPPEALTQVKKIIDNYGKTPALSSSLQSLSRQGQELASQARREGIQPELLFYLALAETDGGRTGSDTAAEAKKVLPDLLSLRATFGMDSADSCLIVIAAYKIGAGTKKSHPLLATMRKLVRNPSTERNVWFLHDHGGLSDDDYDFITKFIALGIIAQNPKLYGVEAQPLAF